MKLFEGEVGRWFVVEWLPPHLLVAAIVPLLIFWKVPHEPPLHAFLNVFGAGDMLAVSFCLTISAIASVRLTEAQPKGALLKPPKNWVVEAQLVFLFVVMLIVYAALKGNPVDASGDVARAIAYTVVNFLVVLWVTSLIYVMKIKE